MAETICCIFNYAPHYRQEIYLRMEQELECDFYFGDETGSKIKKADYSLFLQHPKELIYQRLFSHVNWLRGSVRLVFQPYRNYLLTGEPYCLSSWAVMLLNRLRGKKNYLWTHGWYGDETPVKRLIKKAYFGLAHGIFLYGPYARKLMLQENFSPDKLHLIYNSLAYTKQFEIRKQIQKTAIYRDHFGTADPVLVFIGRVERKKKLAQLIEAVQLLNERSAVNLCIIGAGNDLETIRAQTVEAGLSQRVWFYGACYDEVKIAELIYNADICVSPGEVGLTAIHALTFGTPVITHGSFPDQMPEFEAIQAGQTGDFFEKDSVSDLARVIKRWLKDHPEKDKELVAKCFRMIDQYYNPNVQLEILKSVLQ